jgi:hypothetical protein
MQSAAECLLKKTDQRVWKRGEQYAADGCVDVVLVEEKRIEATVRGSEMYHVRLNFPGRGISKQCSCPYAKGSQAQHAACKHMVAVALIWDDNRGLPRLNQKQIDEETIPPQPSLRSIINAVYAKPLQADFDTLRTLSDQGRWSRPHAHLPARPKFSDNFQQELELEEVKQALREIAKWRHRSSYDPYFCAGEMVAAFCEVMRSIRRRLKSSNAVIAGKILLEAQKFHFKLVQEYIDSSDGVQIFGESYLEGIFTELFRMQSSVKGNSEIEILLQKYQNRHDEGYN